MDFPPDYSPQAKACGYDALGKNPAEHFYIINNIMHESFMAQAIALALESVRAGGGPFGALIVQNGQIIAQGTNRVTAGNDPTAHAEIMAIRAACAALNTFHLQGFEIYCSCEPCPMCLAAIYSAHLDHAFYACTSADAAAAGFGDTLFYEELGRSQVERRLPMKQILADQGRIVFEEWQKYPNKIAY